MSASLRQCSIICTASATASRRTADIMASDVNADRLMINVNPASESPPPDRLYLFSFPIKLGERSLRLIMTRPVSLPCQRSVTYSLWPIPATACIGLRLRLPSPKADQLAFLLFCSVFGPAYSPTIRKLACQPYVWPVTLAR